MRNDSLIKDADFARKAIALIARDTKQLAARRRLAEVATSAFANYTDEAKALWAEYLAAGCPAA